TRAFCGTYRPVPAPADNADVHRFEIGPGSSLASFSANHLSERSCPYCHVPRALSRSTTAQCSCSAKMSPPNCSAKMSPPKLGGGLESKAVTKNRSDRECGGRASECGRSGPGAGAQRAAGEATEADVRLLRAERATPV